MKILVVAGEASADLHLAEIIHELKRRGSVDLLGIGGDRLAAQGLVKPLRTAREMAVMGLAEVIRRIPATLRLLDELAELGKKEKPDFALLCDLPDFNLRLAPKLKAAGIPVIYYVSPQVWAWRSGRVHAMAECIDLLLSIFPFEPAWYEKNAPQKLRVEFVGHPALEEIADLPYAPKENRIALLPGSREGEFSRLLPDILKAAVLCREKNPAWNFILPLAEPLRNSASARALLDPQGELHSEWQKLGSNISVVEKSAAEILRECKSAIVASGTATLETAIVGVPMVVVYKIAAISAFIFKYFVNYSGPIAMANLIHLGIGAKERVVPELIQSDCTPDKIAQALLEINQDEKWHSTAKVLASTRSKLGGIAKPITLAADRIQNFLRERRQ